MTSKTAKKTDAQVLRELARDYEQGVQYCSFSCINVEEALGADVRHAYEQAFGFGTVGTTTANDKELWETEDQQSLRDRRILLLCFAAAMAETGDL